MGIFFVGWGVLRGLLVDWGFLGLKVVFFFNRISFSLILLLVTLRVLLFASYYMEGDRSVVYFLLVLVVFVVSIFLLNLRGRVFIILISWDVLGVSSFFLVLFYNNWDRCRGAMNTVLTNRVGDYFLFLFFRFFLFGGSFFYFLVFRGVVLGSLLLGAGFTKRAQFPFSGWLPKAISAPTPVRALVHRRTLVTAGLILMMNFSVLVLNYWLSVIMFVGGLLTIFFSSLSAVVEVDMKKVVALSTLSQIGFAAMTFGSGYYFVRFVHLLSHAIFKSCLFIQVGVFIHRFFRQQDRRGYSGLGESLFYVQFQMLVTLFCLCGLIFTRGAVTKDIILYGVISVRGGMVLRIIFFFGVFLTFCYSYKLFYNVVKSCGKAVSSFVNGGLMMVFSFFLVMFAIFFLWWFGNNVLLVPEMFVFVDFYMPLFYVVFLLLGLFFFFKVILCELVYKFVVDYDARQARYLVGNVKSLDLYAGLGVTRLLRGLGGLSSLVNVVMKNYIMVVFSFVFLFLLVIS